MEQSKVYFTDFRCHPGVNQQQKLEKLMLAAGMGDIDFDGKIVAIKLHFGEVGNLAYLRPNYAKTVVDFIKARGGSGAGVSAASAVSPPSGSCGFGAADSTVGSSTGDPSVSVADGST